MKRLSILFILLLAIGGSAYAQSDTSVTAASQGTYPAGTSFNGINISGLQFTSGTFVGADGTSEGQVTIALLGTTALGTKQTIDIDGKATGGSHSAANVATITGTCSIDMGDGTLPVTGVPFVATITTDAQHLGTVGLVLGSTALPTAAINAGSLTIDNLQ